MVPVSKTKWYHCEPLPVSNMAINLIEPVIIHLSETTLTLLNSSGVYRVGLTTDINKNNKRRQITVRKEHLSSVYFG